MNRVVANSMADYISKEEYAALLEISQIISSSMDVEEILDQYLPKFDEQPQQVKLNLPKLKKVETKPPKVELPKLKKVK